MPFCKMNEWLENATRNASLDTLPATSFLVDNLCRRFSTLLTHKRLKELLHYDHGTGIFTWRVSPAKNVKGGDAAGSTTNGYRRIKIDGKSYLAHRLAWLYVHGYLPENHVDHIDRTRHHNWFDNLREVSRSCNLRNTGNPKDNTSGVKGVVWDKSSGKWKASICANGKAIHLGLHTDFMEATCYRLAAEQAEGWRGCDDSSPAYKYVTGKM